MTDSPPGFEAVLDFRPFQQSKLLISPARHRSEHEVAIVAAVDGGGSARRQWRRVDNIIKPIQDALEGIIYDNDEAVVDVCSRKINFRQLPPHDVAPPTLSAELTEPRSNFVYIRIAEARNLLEFQ